MSQLLVCTLLLAGFEIDLKIDRERRLLEGHQDGRAYSVQAPSGLVFDQRSVYTGFDTCTWMKCDGSPAVRSPVTLRITAPREEWVIASGTLTGIETLESGERRFIWAQERPYPAYLYGFVIGPLRSASTDIDGSIVEVASAVASAEDLQRCLHAHRGMIAFFENAAGLPLPGRRYTAVIVDGAAAQEKSTFSLLGTSQLSPLASDPTEDWLLAHELAHQWWGNLVTPASWSEMWLSEGVVTFMTAAWKEHRWGREKYEREMELARRRVDAAVKEGFDVPLAWEGEYPSLRTRRAIAYSRGALFMDLLRRELGEVAFWRALRSFTRRYAGRSVTGRDFQKTFEEASGRDLSPLFGRWVYGDVTQRREGSR